MVVIAGSTGVGKTDCALELGNHIPIEIINADLGQFYTPLTIGTAKPPWKESAITHHLFDIFSDPRQCTVAEFRTQVSLLLHDIWGRGKIPVIVGGSTFYIESMFFELQHAVHAHNELLHTPILEHASLWQTLHNLDSERAAAIHPHDSYRIKRSLMMWNATGIKPSAQKPMYKPLAPYLFVGLVRDRAELYQRINTRVGSMVENGWIDEIRTLMKSPWEDFIRVKKFIGYSELMDYSVQEGSWSPCQRQQQLQQAMEIIAQKTRNYAKRQETFWRRLEKKLSHCLVMAPGYTNTQLSKAVIQNITRITSDELSTFIVTKL